MKHPKKPIAPKEPSQTLFVEHSDCVPCGKTLVDLLALVPTGLDYNDVIVESTGEYGDSDIYVCWVEELPNPKYEAEMIVYREKLAKYEVALAAYVTQKASYDAGKEFDEKLRRNKQIEALERQLKQLKKSV